VLYIALARLLILFAGLALVTSSALVGARTGLAIPLLGASRTILASALAATIATLAALAALLAGATTLLLLVAIIPLIPLLAHCAPFIEMTTLCSFSLP
jgi:hypothetical protein